MKFTTLIPKTYNDGAPVKPALLDRLIKDLRNRFGGMTIDYTVSGYWVDDDNNEYTDDLIRVSIACDRDRLSEAEHAVRRIGRKLKQKAMYFEVFGYDGVQILEIESEVL